MTSRCAKGIKKAGGPSGPPAPFAAVTALRQVKKGTDIPRAGAPRGATIRSAMAAVLARRFVVICA